MLGCLLIVPNRTFETDRRMSANDPYRTWPWFSTGPLHAVGCGQTYAHADEIRLATWPVGRRRRRIQGTILAGIDSNGDDQLAATCRA